MCSILKQLSCIIIKLLIRELVAGIYKKIKEEADDDEYKSIKLTLDKYIKLILALLETNSVIIIINALDECDSAY
jgi:hypothetical protein